MEILYYRESVELRFCLVETTKTRNSQLIDIQFQKFLDWMKPRGILHNLAFAKLQYIRWFYCYQH